MRFLSRLLCSGAAALTAVLPAGALAGAAPPTSRLAWFSGGKLLVGLAGGRYVTLAPRPGNAFQPAFSHDGRYLAFLWQSPPPNAYAAAGPGFLWLSRGDGRDPHQISSIGYVSGFSWSPTADRLVVQTQNGANLLLDWNGVVTRLPSGRVSGLPSWSPDGRNLAIGVTSRQGYSRLHLLTGRADTSRSFPGLGRYALPILAGWWGPHHLLYWVDPDSSASIAADGMQLVNLDLRTVKIRNLGVMLGYHDWLAVSGRRLLLVKGNDRSAFFGKHLWLCSLDGSCRAIPGLPKGGISLDPVWSPDGRSLAFIVARAWNTSGIISDARYRSWLDSHVLWIASGDGSGAHPLAGVPRGAADPEWTPDGRGLLFERDGSLWLIPHVGASNAHPIAVLTKHVFPDLHHPAYQRWYYGHMDWHDLFAWH